MVIAITRTKTEEIVLPSDAGSVTPTVFVVRPLSGGGFADFSAYCEGPAITARGAVAVLDDAVVGWRALPDAQGAEVPVPSIHKGRVLVDVLRPEDLIALCREIVNRAMTTEADRKNSGSPPSA